jgi:hypothetical protein
MKMLVMSVAIMLATLAGCAEDSNPASALDQKDALGEGGMYQKTGSSSQSVRFGSGPSSGNIYLYDVVEVNGEIFVHLGDYNGSYRFSGRVGEVVTAGTIRMHIVKAIPSTNGNSYVYIRVYAL